MEIGQRIKKLRLEKGLKQYQLANLSYLAFESLCRIENGLYYPSRKVIKLIADALGCEMDSLIKNAKKKSRQKNLKGE